MYQFIVYTVLAIGLLYAGHQIGRAIGRMGKGSAPRKDKEEDS